MNFACELIDLCRGTQEVEAVVSEGTGCGEPLARLKMAIRYQEKKVVIVVYLNVSMFTKNISLENTFTHVV